MCLPLYFLSGLGKRLFANNCRLLAFYCSSIDKAASVLHGYLRWSPVHEDKRGRSCPSGWYYHQCLFYPIFSQLNTSDKYWLHPFKQSLFQALVIGMKIASFPLLKTISFPSHVGKDTLAPIQLMSPPNKDPGHEEQISIVFGTFPCW